MVDAGLMVDGDDVGLGFDKGSDSVEDDRAGHGVGIWGRGRVMVMKRNGATLFAKTI